MNILTSLLLSLRSALDQRSGTSRRRRTKPNHCRLLATKSTEPLESRFVLAAPNPLSLIAMNTELSYRINGLATSDDAGFAVSGVGDMNGDGYDDVVIGARYASPGGDSKAGESFVLFGPGYAANPLDARLLNGATGFRIQGIDVNDFSGWSVSGAGDVNGDGLGDLIIGARYADPGGFDKAGESYVVFGKSTGFSATLDLATLDASRGFRIDGVDAEDQSGQSVSGAGDVNGDGFDDLIVGAPGGDPGGNSNAGRSYVVFGRASGFGTSLSLSSINGSNGFRLDGIDTLDASGMRVSGVGDVNGDGFDDVIVGARDADPNSMSQAGESYVVFGAAGPFPASIALSTLDGVSGFRIEGIASSDYSGASVSSAGDVNGDGLDDLLIGAFGSDPVGDDKAGDSFVVFGRSSAFPATVRLGSLDGTNGFRLAGIDPDDESAWQAAGAGDVNGDGFDDVIIGARNADQAAALNTGEVYIVFGKAGVFAATVDLSTLNGITGFRIDGARADDFTGASVSAAGDFDGDGFDDVIIGATGVGSQYYPRTGAAYIVFGGNFTGGFETQVGKFSDNNTFTANRGASSIDILIGAHGNDTLISDGGSDVLRGDPGNDTLTIPDADFSGTRRLDGGTGDDTLRLTGTDVALDLTQIRDNRIVNIEAIDLTGGGVNVLTLNAREVTNITGTGNRLLVRRDSADVVNRGAGWTQVANETILGETYEVFQNGAASLWILDPSIPRTGFLSVSSLNGANGFRIDGADTVDLSGSSVSGAGDINGDGFADLIIGAPKAEVGSADEREGQTYVVFGKSSGFSATMSLSSLNGTDGFRIDGIDPSDMSGSAVNRAGDVNGDGVDDLIIGAKAAAPSGGFGLGQAYVVFGKRTAFTSVVSLSALNGSDGFVINGKDTNDSAGASVSAAGDINGDGFDDLIIGAPKAENTGSITSEGQTFVVFGQSAFASTLNVASLNGTNGFRIDGIDRYDQSGNAVSSAGDINGDGFADLLIGAAFAEPAVGVLTGECYVIFGKSTGFTAAMGLSALNGTNGFRIEANTTIGQAGNSVAPAGDFNGDGFNDLILGAVSTNANSGVLRGGAAFVLFGRGSGFAPVFKLADVNGSDGFRVPGNHYSGYAGVSVSGGGDINGDGFDDLIVGAYKTQTPGGRQAGEVYVMYGKAGPATSQLDLALLSGQRGFTIQGAHQYDLTGQSVSNAGDVNGDGFDDIVLGAPQASPDGRTAAGVSYVVFGAKSSTGQETQVGSNAANSLTANRGANQVDILIGGAGNDRLTSDGGPDVLHGDQGDDLLLIRSLDFHQIDGGTGFDSLQFNASGLNLNLVPLANNRLTSIEQIDIRGFGANTLTLNAREVLNITSGVNLGNSANTLRVRRGSDDAVSMGTGWVQQANTVFNGLTWQVFKQGAAVLQIEILTFSSPQPNTPSVRPVFTWASVPGVTDYELWANNDSANVASFVRTAVTGTSTHHQWTFRSENTRSGSEQQMASGLRRTLFK